MVRPAPPHFPENRREGEGFGGLVAFLEAPSVKYGAAQEYGSEHASMWKLTIEDDEGKQTALPLAHEEYSLGRGEANAIRLTDRNISRTHSVLKKVGLGWVVKDLQSYNGTFVN